MKCTCFKFINNPLYCNSNNINKCCLHKNQYKNLLYNNYHMNNISNTISSYFIYILKDIFPLLSNYTLLSIYRDEIYKYINYLEVIHREYYTKLFIKKTDMDYNHEIWINNLKKTYNNYNFDTSFKNIINQLFNPLKILNLYMPKIDHNTSGILFYHNRKSYLLSPKYDNGYIKSCGILFNKEKYCSNSLMIHIKLHKNIPIQIISILYKKKINYINIYKALNIMIKESKIIKYDKKKFLNTLFPSTYNDYIISNNKLYCYDNNIYYIFDPCIGNIKDIVNILNKYNIEKNLILKYKSKINEYLNVEVNYKNKIYKRI